MGRWHPFVLWVRVWESGVGVDDLEWPIVPKPEPTPLFDEWKRCPKCNFLKTELRCALAEANVLTLYFRCPSCGHESEHRTALFD